MPFSAVAGPLLGAVAGQVVGGLFAGDEAAKTAAQQERANTGQEEVAKGQLALAAKQDARSEEAWNRYKSTQLPLEDQFIDESRGMASKANQEKAAGDAAAGVSASFANARDRLNKNPGVNPSSQQYQQESSKIGLAEAATSAAAQTGARETVKDRGQAAMTNAISLGRGLPATANSLATSSGYLGGSAGGLYGSLGASGRQGVQDAYSAGKSFGDTAGGVFGSKAVQGWLSKQFGGDASGTGSVSGGYTNDGVRYNNPSASVDTASYTAPASDGSFGRFDANT